MTDEELDVIMRHVLVDSLRLTWVQKVIKSPLSLPYSINAR